MISSSLIRQSRRVFPSLINQSRRSLSFSFAGPRSLDEIVKKDLLKDKSAAEVADIWYSYHESRDNVHGIVLKGTEGQTILKRAKDCPYFVQPVFRDDGFFMLMSEFQEPSHFLLAYLEDYKMDPARAQPLMTFSVFLDYATKYDMTLVRCDIVNKGIQDDEGLKVVNCLLDSYKTDEEYLTVKTFNKHPNTFDIDDYISCQNQKWKKESGESI
jgi:hypothetical protein